MSNFAIDNGIREQFKYYTNMCSLLSEYKKSKFYPPASIEKIEDWEKCNNINLPHQYKSWLMLTSQSIILDSYIDFIWPTIGSLEKDNDIIIIASVIGDGEDICISCDTGKIFSTYSGGIDEYEDFDDLLTCLSGFMEDTAEHFLGQDWGDIYDERFGTE